MSATLQPTRPGPPDQKPAPSLVSRLPEIAGRAAWKHRFRLAPLYLGGVATLGVAAGSGLPTAGGLGLTAAVLVATANYRTTNGQPLTWRGRMLLSIRERKIAAAGAGATAAWAALMSIPVSLPWFAGPAVLSTALGWPTVLWVSSRQAPPPPVALRSPFAQAALDGWAEEISVGGGVRMMHGSVPIEDSIQEPAPDTLIMRVKLARSVHSADAISSVSRRGIERAYAESMGMGVDTVTLRAVREDPSIVEVVLAPGRPLEVEGGMPYQGPILYENGLMPLADCTDGTVIDIPLHDDSGVKHGFITGTSGAGKSATTADVILPGVIARIELVIYCDGKAGASTPIEIDPAVTRMAITPAQWMAAIEMVDRILEDRKARFAKKRKNTFVVGTETLPIITLLLDEATDINAGILGKHVKMVATIARQGRSLGIRVVQVTQSPAAEDIIGDVAVRNLITSSGWVIAHRAGGSGASRLTLDSAPGVDIDLRGLLNGQAAILAEGRVLAPLAAVRHATKPSIAAALIGHVTLELEDPADLAAAGPAYAPENWAVYENGELVETTPPTVSGPNFTKTTTDPAGDLPASRAWVLTTLRAHPGLTLGQLGDIAETDDDAPSRSTISRALADLYMRMQVTKEPGGIWTAKPAELTDEEPTT